MSLEPVVVLESNEVLKKWQGHVEKTQLEWAPAEWPDKGQFEHQINNDSNNLLKKNVKTQLSPLIQIKKWTIWKFDGAWDIYIRLRFRRTTLMNIRLLANYKGGKEEPYCGEAWQAPPESNVKVNIIKYRRMEIVSRLIVSMRKTQYHLCDIAIRGIAEI